MRIDAQIVGRRDVEVEIDFDDFMERAFSGKDGDHTNLERINGIGGLLKRIPDTAISEMTDVQRNVVAKFLHGQAERFVRANQIGANHV